MTSFNIVHIYFVFRMVAQVTRLPHNVDPEYLGLQTYTVTTRIISLQVLWLISHKPPLFILMVHRGFSEILRIKRSFFAIERVLNESQGVPWTGEVCKSKFVRHTIFFTWLNRKLRRCVRLDLLVTFSKNLSYWTRK